LSNPSLQKNRVETRVNIDDGIKPLYVDRYRIQTALMNIIQNALEAMPQGGKITVSVKTIFQDGLVAVTINDTGTGMPPDMIEKACEPFF